MHQSRTGAARSYLVALLTLAALATCLGLSTSGHHNHHHHHQQHSQLHSSHTPEQPHAAQQQPQHQPPPPPPAYSPPAHPSAATNAIQPSAPVLPTNAAPAAAPASGPGLGKSLATGALIGVAGAGVAAAVAQSGHARPTRHLLGAPKSYVDLSHPLHNGTLHWPTMADIQYTTLIDGERTSKQGQSYYVKADALNANIHSGTHLDAPRHFSKTGWSVEQIPLDRLIDVPLTVIDVSAKVKMNRSYEFVVDDFMGLMGSLVQAGSVVLVYTGVSQAYDQGREAYMGTNSSNISEMKIPGFSAEAAKYLVERGVFGVGLDSPSADSSQRHGQEGMESFEPTAHVILNSNNVYILENVNNKLAGLVNAKDARLTIAPLPIVGGSGSQVRLVAILGHDAECHCERLEAPLNNSPQNHHQYSSLTILIAVFLCLVSFLLVG